MSLDTGDIAAGDLHSQLFIGTPFASLRFRHDIVAIVCDLWCLV